MQCDRSSSSALPDDPKSGPYLAPAFASSIYAGSELKGTANEPAQLSWCAITMGN